MNTFSHTETLRPKRVSVKEFASSLRFRFSLFGLVVFLVGFQVVEISSLSARGYEMSKLEKQIHEMEQENNSLELQIAEYRSLESIQNRLERLNLVAVSSPEYLSLDPHKQVARR